MRGRSAAARPFAMDRPQSSRAGDVNYTGGLYLHQAQPAVWENGGPREVGMGMQGCDEVMRLSVAYLVYVVAETPCAPMGWLTGPCIVGDVLLELLASPIGTIPCAR